LNHSSLSSDKQDDKGAPSLSRSAPAKEPLLPVDFAAAHASLHQRPMLSYSSTSAEHLHRAQPPTQHIQAGAASRRRRRRRYHRPQASRKRFDPEKLSYRKLRCADIKYPKACCGEGRAFNKHLILLRDK